MAISFSTVSTVAVAEVAKPAASNTGEIISRIEQALVEVSKSDFSNAQVQLKAARAAADLIKDESDTTKQGYALVIQGQILAKRGDVQNATSELNKALALYKSL